MPPSTRARAKQLTVNTDGPNCCGNGGEHLYGRDLMYPIAIICAVPYGNNPPCTCVCVCVAVHVTGKCYSLARGLKKIGVLIEIYLYSLIHGLYLNAFTWTSKWRTAYCGERVVSRAEWGGTGVSRHSQPMMTEFRRPRLRKADSRRTKATDEVNEFPSPPVISLFCSHSEKKKKTLEGLSLPLSHSHFLPLWMRNPVL